jgi:hypothetical protein
MKQLLWALIVLGCMTEATFASGAIKESSPQTTPEEQPFFNANKAAFVTTMSFAALSIASAMGAMTAANTANTFALVSYSALAVTGVALSIAGMTAWVSFGDHRATTDAGTYFQKVGDHAAIAIVGVTQFVALTLTQAVVQGAAHGISKSISRSISGPDQTIRMVQ